MPDLAQVDDWWRQALLSNQPAASAVLAAAGGDDHADLAALAYSRAALWVNEAGGSPLKNRVGEMARDWAFALSLPRRLKLLTQAQQQQPHAELVQQTLAQLHAALMRYQAAPWYPLPLFQPIAPGPSSSPASAVPVTPSLAPSTLEPFSVENIRLARVFGLTLKEVFETSRAVEGTGYAIEDVLTQATLLASDSAPSGGHFLKDWTLPLARNGFFKGANTGSDLGLNAVLKDMGALPAEIEQMGRVFPLGSLTRFVDAAKAKTPIGLQGAIYLATHRAMLPRRRIASSLQEIQTQLTAAWLNDRPQVAEIQLQLQDGRRVHWVAYLDEHGQLQLAEKLRMRLDAPHQGAYPLMRNRKGEFLYPYKVKNSWQMQPLQNPMLAGGLAYQLFPATQLDQSVRHARSFAQLLQQLDHQASFGEQEAQVWAVNEQGRAMRFNVRVVHVRSLQNSSLSKLAPLLTSPSLNSTQLASLRQLRYVLAPLSQPVRIEPAARSPAETSVNSVVFAAQGSTRGVQLGRAHVLQPAQPKQMLDVAAIELAGRRYFIEADLGAHRRELRVNVLADNATHFQLHFTAHPRPEGPGWTVEVEYLDENGMRLSEDRLGRALLPSINRHDGQVLGQQNWKRVLVELYEIARHGRLPETLYRDPLIDSNRSALAGNKPPVLTPLEKALASGRGFIEAALNQGAPPERLLLLDVSKKGTVEAIKTDRAYNLHHWPRQDFLANALEQAKRLHDLWANPSTTSPPSPKALVMTLGFARGPTRTPEFFQIRVSAFENLKGVRTHRVELLDMKAQPLATDLLNRPYLVCTDGKPWLLEGLLIPQAILATFAKVRLQPHEIPVELPTLKAKAKVPQVPVEPLDINSTSALATHQERRQLQLNKVWRLKNMKERGVSAIESLLTNMGWREGQQLIANATARNDKGDVVVSFLVKIYPVASAIGMLMWHGEAIDLLGQPLDKKITFGGFSKVIEVQGPGSEKIRLGRFSFTEMVFEFHPNPNPEPEPNLDSYR
jgi:hypothetical protein